MGPRAAWTLAVGVRGSFLWSAANTQQPALSLPCSQIQFGVLTGSTDRIRWYYCVSRGATSLDGGAKMGGFKEVRT